MELDTIAAISTPPGEGAIAIIRISGDDSVAIAERMYRGNQNLRDVDSHTIHYGHLVQPATNETVEEVMVTVLRAPKTFTRDDIIEINVHGGVVSADRVLQLVLTEGARLAEPGEFTKRAFLNGRIDLSQAEGVMDMIRAKTDRAMNVAMKQVEGRLARQIKTLRSELLEAIAHVEVNIDYPEYDAESVTLKRLEKQITAVQTEIDQLLATAHQGKILREGLATAIIGRPNVGKSSLMNALVQDNRAIVTEIPGTTRDVLEEYVNVKGVPLRLIDTAGIRETEDVVEKIGVERSRQALSDAELIVLVLNANETLTEEDKALFATIEDFNAIVVLNKTDLKKEIDESEARDLVGDRPLVTTSLLKEEGIEDLEAAISHLFFDEGVEGTEINYVSNTRHIALLNQAKATINEALDAAQADMPVDMVQIDVKRAWEHLGEIVGETAPDQLIDQLFSQFCLGK
ncbi:tRNA uridine-5-carboxymethylaminomethyl(34) synthesis GTPase MnmE [Salicibibacter halophilus]|uniref:tRNA modification GTPase MnmE n=1 Tax=Salicibibacter halophilus TaxID=2502791 RepID=A0A514LIG6_9BACI|nr:tRNA uridine-5-carboxymethylaminomethyl(34) synthesis GTPase MnmE [Salicibibacter halophilus]QDI91643.1 tRNA uridine-5-carboxymethylaminomethyl(34) synthesis GTPase MnmE [Salicibibacter halophilus]